MNRRITFPLLALTIILSSCRQIDPNKQVDEGTVEKNSYSSKEIGWSITIPNNWNVISKEQTDKYQEKGLDAMGELVEGEIDVSGLRNLIGFEKDRFNIFQSTSEPFQLEYDGEWQENNAGIKELIYNAYRQQGIKADSTATTVEKIDGLDFLSYTFTIYAPNGDVILNQIVYSRLINGFDFGVNINYNNDSDKKEMMDAWLGSKFKR
ncbi:hypothetical protein [Spongiivirga citrea]|uniref:Uncharacterized protein n=1 Tax=Spongiivirga citrea TaxID=1481457 RepID=A0A6M0CKG5_9FLAO|nr:hypothetical protein [Spongiivirga citrea]NER15907.1 hypothetical protein [Spongiivirga citrea]